MVPLTFLLLEFVCDRRICFVQGFVGSCIDCHWMDAVMFYCTAHLLPWAEVNIWSGIWSSSLKILSLVMSLVSPILRFCSRFLTVGADLIGFPIPSSHFFSIHLHFHLDGWFWYGCRSEGIESPGSLEKYLCWFPILLTGFNLYFDLSLDLQRFVAIHMTEKSASDWHAPFQRYCNTAVTAWQDERGAGASVVRSPVFVLLLVLPLFSCGVSKK